MEKGTTVVANGFFTLLLLIFVCAKIFGIEPVAHWSWWWVLAPFWIPLAIGLVILVSILALAARAK